MTNGNINPKEVAMSATIVFDFDVAKERLEADPVLPFAPFGFTGGYGLERRHLVDAIRSGKVAAAEIFFEQLVEQSLLDAIDAGVATTRAQALEAFAEYLAHQPEWRPFVRGI